MTRSACVFCIDDAYLMPFQVFFHSLENTNSIPTTASLFILHTAALSSTSIGRLEAFLGRYGRSASFVDATSLIPVDLPIRPGDHVSPATFYRLWIAEILPAEIEQAVYLDADMLALRSIAPLFNEPVQGLVAAADHCSPTNEIRLWGERGGTYFQAGVLVIPLQIWREQEILQRFLEVMANQQERIQWWDQDVLNIALRDHWQRLSIWCNVCEAVHQALPLPLIETQAALIHYSGSSKPWNAYNPSPFTANWDQAYEAVFRHPFNREALRPPRPPLPTRLKAAVRSRIARLVHGRQ
ncbi:glycosyltransferase family 8 protein [Vulcanococcus limneticus]|uniref:glycosyltransferase family 8 protein n=1 Tax=Vulcanococcus limneticus TaxID=2170428 RepID=UPI00398C0FCB